MVTLEQPFEPFATDFGRTVVERKKPFSALTIYQRCGLRHEFHYDPKPQTWEQLVTRDCGDTFRREFRWLIGSGGWDGLELLFDGICVVDSVVLEPHADAINLTIGSVPALYDKGRLEFLRADVVEVFSYDFSLGAWFHRLE